jgi:hypothetical protein
MQAREALIRFRFLSPTLLKTSIPQIKSGLQTQGDICVEPDPAQPQSILLPNYTSPAFKTIPSPARFEVPCSTANCKQRGRSTRSSFLEKASAKKRVSWLKDGDIIDHVGDGHWNVETDTEFDDRGLEHKIITFETMVTVF